MRVLALLALAARALAADGFTVTDDLRHGPVRAVRAVGPLDEARFRRAALRLLSPPTIRFGTLTAHRSRQAAFRADGQGGTECSYESWQDALAHWRLAFPWRDCPERMQALKLGDALALRLSDAHCQVQLVTVRGAANPLEVELDGAWLRIVDMAVSETGSSHLRLPHVGFFVVTDGAVTPERATAFLRHMERLSPGTEMSVTLRGDAWFPNECQFPLLSSLLTRPGRPPTKAEFLSSRQVHCSLWRQWPLGCYSTGGRAPEGGGGVQP